MTTEKLQKVLARAGVGSRREMERWIAEGRVSVDGRTAQLGDRVGAAARIAVDGRPLGKRAAEPLPRRVLAYHKPAGEVVTRQDPEGRRTVFTRLPRLRGGRWVAIGRLDVNTSGLLLFTTDGSLASRLMHPSYRLPRDYAVRVFGHVSEAMLERLREGVTLDDGKAAFERIETLAAGEAANEWYRVRVREGRNRLVRRLWESQGVTVSRLMRVQYGPVALPPNLREGQHHELGPGAVDELCTLVDLPAEASAGDRRKAAPRRPRRRPPRRG
ncbi:23S rRNA pseudouridine(2605) synthase RluB [Sediminicurvatus halobius]|uniref:Pseudouridine synthase n=1 Tax=Sediminicurvatus halobius TaxID=2182432 RepID=A0A2U2N317_9GAMM|nr:pseudouridine synthase [Spiribacter halobius]PWG63490.1 23S rRNA pseudouridylate synthase B [Spiribacter halobius]UEX79639.1 pseudouridine synthase [Spiribacter halobius]